MNKKPKALRPILIGAIISACTLPIVGYCSPYTSQVDLLDGAPICTYVAAENVTVNPSESDLVKIAQTVYGEARGCSKTEQAAVVWCILNRIDDPRWPDTIDGVVTQSQFHGYSTNQPVTPEIYALVLDVYARYTREKAGDSDVGRVLPKEYVFFHGDGKSNHFRMDFSYSGAYWDWSLPSPYKGGD